MQTHGRLLVRANKTAGLYIPMSTGLPEGIYEIREVLGELTLTLVGTPAMPKGRLNGMSVSELVGEPGALMTKAELNKAAKTTV